MEFVEVVDKQELALKLVDNGENVFITGGGGRGKSWVIKQILNKYPDDTVVCAPSGSAALLVQGITAHRMFGLPIGLTTLEDNYNHSKNAIKLFGNTTVKRIIIDEAPMLRIDYFTLIDYKLRSLKNKDTPFGGLQIIVVGDFFQLDPIVGWSEKDLFYEKYDTTFAFKSPSWNFKNINLDINKRTVNKRQNKMLDSIRHKDKNYKKAVDIINKEALPYNNSEAVTHLCCYKEDAKRINRYWYNQINAEEFIYTAVIEGNFNEEEFPVDEKVKLKIGSKVVIKTNCQNDSYVNGDVGTVTGLNKICVIVKLNSGRVVFVNINTWEKYTYSTKGGKLSKDVEATFTQMPIKLAWAQTIHSAQGMTLDNVAIDFGKGCFSHGMAYVALSRIRDLTNISFVTPLEYGDIIVNSEVSEFYDGLECYEE